MKKLTNQDFIEAAALLGCEVAAIKAVSFVESKGEGFYANGFPVILFERHKFYKYTDGQFAALHPEICNRSAGGYGSAGANQQRKFNLAFSLNPIAAMKSCSWGKFQIMGFNYLICGFNSVGEFVDAMKISEGEQLKAFCNFVKGNNLSRFLKTLDFARFANGYNGSSYRINNYDKKMLAAYNKFKKEKATFQAEKEPTTQAVSPATLPKDTDQEFVDKYLKHCNKDTLANIGTVVGARIGAGVTGATTLWNWGLHGKVFTILLLLAILAPVVYALYFYLPRIKKSLKAIFDSLFTSV